jgi:hypothetical protein
MKSGDYLYPPQPCGRIEIIGGGEMIAKFLKVGGGCVFFWNAWNDLPPDRK